MLCVGDESFTTIGFQTDGKTVKFKMITKMPGEKTADRDDPYGKRDDPYGKKGFREHHPRILSVGEERGVDDVHIARGQIGDRML
jgi:hypothetical protein